MRATQKGFTRQPVGIHKLEGFVRNLMDECGIPGYYTLHSLRASCATRLYNRGIDEQLITEVTGHRSNAVRDYKRTSEEQRVEVSRILNNDTVLTELASPSNSKKIKVEKEPSTDESEEKTIVSKCKLESGETTVKSLDISCGNLKVSLKF